MEDYFMKLLYWCFTPRLAAIMENMKVIYAINKDNI